MNRGTLQKVADSRITAHRNMELKSGRGSFSTAACGLSPAHHECCDKGGLT